jgi:hypothetical protein
VPSDEQASAKEVAGDALVSSTSMTSLPQLAATGGGAPMNEEEASRWQMEKQGLCQQLDEKVRPSQVSDRFICFCVNLKLCGCNS